MLNINSIVKAIIISATLNAIYIFMVSASNFQKVLSPGISKIDAFIKIQETMNIWPRLFESWFYSFSICFVSCVILLLWLKKST